MMVLYSRTTLLGSNLLFLGIFFRPCIIYAFLGTNLLILHLKTFALNQVLHLIAES
jgi:hypothetical protein